MTTETQFILFLPIILIALFVGMKLEKILISWFDNLSFVRKHLRTEEEKIMEKLEVD